MKTSGYIHLHRSLLTWDYHNNPIMFSVWAHLLMLAEYEDCQYEGITIHRGELIVSQQWLAQKVGITEKQLRLCLQKLEEGNEISKKKAGKKTMITILKFAGYQADTNPSSSEGAIKTPTSSDEKGQQKGDIGRNINNNIKNLSDGEIQKSTPQGSASSRTAYAKQLAAHEGWKQKCCRDRHISPGQIDHCIIAFHEHLLRNNPGKTWLSFNDFCLHFHSWLRYQKPEDIANLLAQAMHRSRQQKAKVIERQRQQQMWQDIEASKRNAVSYEEYKRSHSNSES